MNGQPATELYLQVNPVSFVVTPEGNSEMSHFNFSKDHFNMGQGEDVAVRHPQGARIKSAEYSKSAGLTLTLSTGHIHFIPSSHLSGTYKVAQE